MLILSPLGGAGAQFLDNNGNPLSGGKLYVYEAGTTTPAVTYTTEAGNVAHTNPVVLDSAGRVPGGQVWTDSNESYKFVLKTANDVTVSTWDNVLNRYVTETSDGSIDVTSVTATSFFEDGEPLSNRYSPILSDPVGLVAPFAGSVAPEGWLICGGAEVDRSTYARLFAVIGTTYGSGDGSTTFNLPDLRGRTVIGVGAGAGLTVRALNDKGGKETHVLTEAEMPVHDHTSTGLAYSTTQNVSSIQAGSGVTWVDNLAPLVQGSTQIDLSSTGSGGAHENMQPYIALNYIIRV